MRVPKTSAQNNSRALLHFIVKAGHSNHRATVWPSPAGLISGITPSIDWFAPSLALDFRFLELHEILPLPTVRPGVLLNKPFPTGQARLLRSRADQLLWAKDVRTPSPWESLGGHYLWCYRPKGGVSPCLASGFSLPVEFSSHQRELRSVPFEGDWIVEILEVPSMGEGVPESDVFSGVGQKSDDV